MAFMGLLKKQFIEVIEWTEDENGVLALRYPTEDREIQNGAQLTVRDTQLALFVNEDLANFDVSGTSLIFTLVFLFIFVFIIKGIIIIGNPIIVSLIIYVTIFFSSSCIFFTRPK